MLFKGRQVLIPRSTQKEILEQLHQGHQGVEKTRRLARESVYWVNINKDVERTCNSCETCQEHQDAHRKEPLIPHELPSRPLQFIASDLFEIDNKQYLLIADRYSKYPLVDVIRTPVTSQAVTDRLKAYCALFGRPDEIMTVNGPQYSGQPFKKFVDSWGINHVTSSPHYARSNGFIERSVRHIKPIIKKTIRNREDVQLTLLNLRATPIDTGLPSPGEMMFGRPIATLLPQRSMPAPIEQRERMARQQANMKDHHDQSSRQVDLPPLYTGQRVRILDKTTKTWCPGTVVEKCQEARSYIVETLNGTRVRRNRSHLRDMTVLRRSVSFADECSHDQALKPMASDVTHTTKENICESPIRESPTTRSSIEKTTVDGGMRTRCGRVVIRPTRFDI